MAGTIRMVVRMDHLNGPRAWPCDRCGRETRDIWLVLIDSDDANDSELLCTTCADARRRAVPN